MSRAFCVSADQRCTAAWLNDGSALTQRFIIASNFDPERSRTDVCKLLRSGTSATYLVYALLVRRASRRRKRLARVKILHGQLQRRKLHEIIDSTQLRRAVIQDDDAMRGRS
jgi:hypothetical protein